MWTQLINTEVYKGFTIRYYAEEENEPLEDTFANDVDSIKELYQRLDNGSSVYFCAKVTASIDMNNIVYEGYQKIRGDIELSSEYLGCCYYDSYEQFITEEGYYNDMRETVVNEALITLKDLYKKYEELSYINMNI